MARAVARAYTGGLKRRSQQGSRELGKPPEAKNVPFAHPAEAANLSYFLFVCSILHVQAWTDVLLAMTYSSRAIGKPRACGLSVSAATLS